MRVLHKKFCSNFFYFLLIDHNVSEKTNFGPRKVFFKSSFFGTRPLSLEPLEYFFNISTKFYFTKSSIFAIPRNHKIIGHILFTIILAFATFSYSKKLVLCTSQTGFLRRQKPLATSRK